MLVHKIAQNGTYCQEKTVTVVTVFCLIIPSEFSEKFIFMTDQRRNYLCVVYHDNVYFPFPPFFGFFTSFLRCIPLAIKYFV